MSHAHNLDEDTFALYQFDEAADNDGNYASSAEYNGVYDLSQGTSTNQPLIQGGYPQQVELDQDGAFVSADFCRWFYGGGQSAGRYMSAAGDAAAASALVADWTVEGWVWVEATDNEGTIFVYGSDSAGEANNYLGALYIRADGGFRTFWQRGAGTAENHSTSGNGYVPTRQWVHVAMRVTESGGTRTCEFFVGGSDVNDDVSAANATGGTSSGWTIGSNIANTIPFEGGIAALRVWSRALTDQEVADLAATASSTDLAGISDADLLAGWHFPEAPGLLDFGPYGLHMRRMTGTSLVMGVTSLLGDDGRAIWFDTSTAGFIAPKRHYWLNLLQGAAEWTIEVWCRHLGGASPGTGADIGIFDYSGGASEAENRNTLATVTIDWAAGGVGTTDRSPVTGWEIAGGANEVEHGTVEMFTSDERLNLHHFGIVKRSIGGGQSEVDWYHQGALAETLGPFSDPVDGAHEQFGAARLLTADVDLGIGTINAGTHGYFDSLRITDRERLAAEIASSYSEGVAHGGAQVTRLNPEIVRPSP